MLTLDAERRWLHGVGAGQANCFEGGWNTKLCPDPKICAQQCAVDGASVADYAQNYGLSTSGNSLHIKFETITPYGKNVGSRAYLMDTEETYKLFHLKNREFAVEIDISSLPCGINAAIYLVAMDAAGGKGVGGNTAGAKFGTGYCDAHCPKDLKFISGEANIDKQHGSCCPEFDIFEGNRVAEAFTVHPCNVMGPMRCEGQQCGDANMGAEYMGVCDSDGCDYNAYRDGAQAFFGPGLAVDTARPITVVTQFVTSDGTDAGQLSEIRRVYVQDGKVIQNAQARVPGVVGNSISNGYCAEEKQAFKGTRSSTNPGNFNRFQALGGMQAMGAALDRGMVLVLSLWDDPASNMRWLDSSSPGILPAGTPGYARGPCARSEGGNVETVNPDAFVTYSNIRYGAIGSTTGGLVRADTASSAVPGRMAGPGVASPAAVPRGAWHKYLTASGQPYWANPVTGESSWTPVAKYASDGGQVRKAAGRLLTTYRILISAVVAGGALLVIVAPRVTGFGRISSLQSLYQHLATTCESSASTVAIAAPLDETDVTPKSAGNSVLPTV